VKANAIHRGLTHLLVTGAILSCAAALGRGSGQDAGGRQLGFSPSLEGLLEDLEGFLSSRVHRGFEADRVEGRGRRIVTGLYAAYHADPSLLEDHVLLRFKAVAGVRYLRDLPRGAVGDEVARNYRKDPRFARLLGDHLASMTDTYALAEHARLLAMAAVPIPSAEQLRREESP
jgi:dGTP triphosphohydrolase